MAISKGCSTLFVLGRAKGAIRVGGGRRMRRWSAMLARHAASASTRAPRVAPEPRLVFCRRASTTARCVSGGMPGSRRLPACRDGTVGPAPGRSRLRARSYHSRWAISVYGKEPGAPMREYEGYEREMAAFRAKGLAFDDAMVNDDPTLGAGARLENESDANDDDAPAASKNADHLGNIEKKWDEEDDAEDEDDDATRGIDEDTTDDDPFHDWGGGDVAASFAAATASGADSANSAAIDPPLPPGLYLVGTPIGNLEDITLRALRVLRSADAVLAEDTRHTGRLLARYGMKKKLVSYHAHNERTRRDSLVERIQSGAVLALVSDAGTPAVADPGADLALAVANAGLKVVPIPGPCAPASAVVAAGSLTPNEESFAFIGFLPPKTTARRKRWRKFSNAPGSVVAFVPPHKLVAVLEDAAVELGERRQCVVCREMTKVHEEFWRGTLAEAAEEFTHRKPRGEITLVVAGVGPDGGFGEGDVSATNGAVSGDDLEAKLSEMLQSGATPSDAARRAAKELGARKKEAYALALRLAGKQ